jgi:hypothetical protein
MVTELKNMKMCIEKLNFDIAGKISVKLEDGRIIIAPLKYFPDIQKLPVEKRKNTQLLMIEQCYFPILIPFIIWKILWVWKVNGEKDRN